MRYAVRLLAVLFAIAPPFAGEELVLRAGATLQFALPQQQRIRVVARAGEPLTVVAESHNCDVDLRIEDESGTLLASDADSGIETNASLVVTPSEERALFVSAFSKPPSNAVIGVRAFRGVVDPLPPEPDAAARGYWELALWRARLHRNAPRVELAEKQLARWPAPEWTDEQRATRDECIERIVQLELQVQARPDELRNRAGRRSVVELIDLALALESRGDLLIGQLLHTLVVASSVVGEVEAKSRALERLLALVQRIRPAHHTDVSDALNGMAVAAIECGDWERNLALNRRSVELFERFHDPQNAPALQAHLNLGYSLAECGDHAGARDLAERALAVCLELRGEQHLETARAYELLSRCAAFVEDAPAERELLARVVAIREKLLPPGNVDLGRARFNLACALDEADGGQRAIAELRAQIEATGDTLPAEHPFVLEDRWALAELIADGPNARDALVEFEELTALRRRVLDDGHVQLGSMRHAHALLLLRLDERERARVVLAELARGGLSALSTSVVFAARERRAHARTMSRELKFALGVAPACAPQGELDALLFEWLETRRAAMCWATPRHQALQRDAAFQELHARWIEACRNVGDMVALATSGQREFSSVELTRAAAVRDELERGLAASSALWRPAVTPTSVAATIAPEVLVVAFARASRLLQLPAIGTDIRSEPAYVVHLVRADARLERIELGSAASIDAAVQRWLEAIRAGSGARDAGEALRRLVLDPVLAKVGAATELRVCADSELTRVPFDALPLGDGFVGERYLVTNVPSLAPREARTLPTAAERTLACVGAPDFDAGSPRAVIDAANVARASTVAARFTPLAHAAEELDAVARAFGQHVGPRIRLLIGASASEAGLRDAVAGAEYVHVATHAYFEDRLAAAAADDGLELQRVRELSPLGLCGLALCGANLAANLDGSYPGILTAEELETLDLADCELIVLAACSTRAGVAAPSEGVASLQSAAHAAGARSVITSLWTTEDAIAKELALEFYRGLWVDGLPAERALWRAKMLLHGRRHRLADWAGWVLTSS